MLNRRQLRLKSMEAIYAHDKSVDKKIDIQIKYFNASTKNFYHLYIFMLSFFVDFHVYCQYREKKSKQNFLTNQTDYLFKKFSKNPFLKKISSDDDLLEKIKNYEINYWNDHQEHLKLIFNKVCQEKLCKPYIDKKDCSFIEHKSFVISIYKRIIANDDRLYEYIEENNISWINDFPLVNNLVLESLKKMDKQSRKFLISKKIYKKKEDEFFGINLIKKVVENEDFLKNEIAQISSNWDEDRIAEIDMVLLKMCLVEFIYFKSIPVKVSINEYLELAKDFSSPKSSVFLNGILDKLSKQFMADGKLNKNKRGLQ